MLHMGDGSYKIDRIRAYALSCAVDGGPVSSLGLMPTRNGVLIEITDGDGVIGWGEAWCNYPPRSNVAKVNLLNDVIGPAVLNLSIKNWHEVRLELQRLFSRMMIHTGEPGAFKHCIAGIDMALADLSARRQSVPLSSFLAGHAVNKLDVPVYCSTPNVERLEELVPQFEASGHQCFKLKVGFGREIDSKNVSQFRKVAHEDTLMCCDANQKWSLPEAVEATDWLEEYDPLFIEEPILADANPNEWVSLSKASKVPLAAGENITSQEKFEEHINERSLNIVQPDIAKWGGVSGSFNVGRYALSKNTQCYLHYMGTALGQIASLHTLAAIGGGGRLELDANPNPLRTDLGDVDFSLKAGALLCPQTHGIGFVPDPSQIEKFTVAKCDMRANKV
ncbi:mandelate racemase/muconate lactonizing enzyme family protein [Ahrensia kielensis]|uniref:Mandelate racemase/muconate lactonizing enzyme family protein n=1 Tax=Ahrensia kielensis TaxID=76980 RepID=A0ABU9TA06_9HYPH